MRAANRLVGGANRGTERGPAGHSDRVDVPEQIASAVSCVKGVVRNRVSVTLCPERAELHVALYILPVEPVLAAIQEVVSAQLPDPKLDVNISVDAIDLRAPGSAPPATWSTQV